MPVAVERCPAGLHAAYAHKALHIKPLCDLTRLTRPRSIRNGAAVVGLEAGQRQRLTVLTRRIAAERSTALLANLYGC